MKKIFTKEEDKKPFEPSKVNLKDIYTPLHDNVVVEVLIRDKTHTGIIIPEQSRERDRVQLVVSVGPDCKTVKIGDWVLVGPTARPMMIELIYKEEDPIKHLQIREFDIMGKVDSLYTKVIEASKPTTLVN